ncbi:phage baseplate assembly protein V [Streptomyces sp. NRRL S-646]|uniref:phage baseplate assembly protein V n=1 Tax=Streptomyces sp. NRRL S-646 TaxID=1463917 RepID=UPI00068C046A|nr:phage baseplate assembly protein V [Streptomyces sp. NRRL S-646]
MSALERVVAKLLERAEHRFYGKYRGTVVDNEDPALLGRLKLSVPSVLGPDVVTGWATPCAPYGGAAQQGFLFVPEREARVWVEFEEGDLEFPIWTGAFWCSPGEESELPGDPQQRPTRKIIRTLKGHTIELEDADGGERIVISDATGNAIEMTADAMTLTAKVPLTLRAEGQPVRIVCSALDVEKG